MRGIFVAMAMAGLVSGCVATGVGPSSNVIAPEDVPTSVLPSEQSMQEGSAASAKGRPTEPEGLSIIQKRHLYARRVMASCVDHAPNFVKGLKSSALQPAPTLSNGARAFADRTFRVAASSNGAYCDVRALGGKLDRFAEGMREAFASKGEVLDWRRNGPEWSGALVIDGVRYRISAEEKRLSAGSAMVARMEKS